MYLTQYPMGLLNAEDLTLKHVARSLASLSESRLLGNFNDMHMALSSYT